MQTDTPDVLLVTDSKAESQAVLGVFQDAAKERARPIEIGQRTYFDLGAHNGARVFLTQSDIDVEGGNSTKQTVTRGMETLQPGTVIQVGASVAKQDGEGAGKSSLPLPFFSELKNAEKQWSGPEVQIQAVFSDVGWILLEAVGRLAAANAASFLLDALQRVPFVRSDVGDENIQQDSEAKSTLPKQPFFFGREKELAIIANAILPESRTWGVLIDGPGGIGKTWLAVRGGHLAPVSDFPHKIFLSAKVRELTPLGEQPRTDFVLPNYLALLSELARELGDKELAKLPENARAESVRRTLAGTPALLVIDNLETLPDTDRDHLYQFLSRLPQGCKAIVTSRRRSDVDARVIRVDRLEPQEALALIDELAKSNRSLAASTVQERQLLYEFTGGNPLLLGWTAGQLGRRGSQCRTIADACAFLKNAPADNNPLEYIFGDLLDTFSVSETAVLAVLTHFTLPVSVKRIAEFSSLAIQQAQVALEDLANRALIDGDAAARTFYLPPLAAKFLGAKRPQEVAQSGGRLADRAYALAIENGNRKYECFPALEAEWPVFEAALPWLVKGENTRLQEFCRVFRLFLEFSGRWDDWQRLELEAEEKAVAANEFSSAGWRALQAGWVTYFRGQAAQVLQAADRAGAHWRKAGRGSVEIAQGIRLLGMGHRLEKNNEAAAGAYREALRLLRQIDGESTEVASLLNDLANIEMDLGNLTAAERNYREALRIAERTNDRHGVAIYTSNLARLELRREDWPAAEKLGRKALALVEDIGRQEVIGQNCHTLAVALAKQGKRSDGLQHAMRAVGIFTRLNQTLNLSYAEAALKACEPEPAAFPSRS